MDDRRADFKKSTDEQEAKTVYYLSMEFLMGRSLKNNLYNLELTETMSKALAKFKVKLGSATGDLADLPPASLTRFQPAVTPQWAIAYAMNSAFSARS